MYEEFFGIDESEQYSFYRVPKLLFTDSRYRNLSAEAKLLYGLFLDRMSISRKNEWIDEKGRVYIIYRVENIMEALGCGNKKAIQILAELEKKGNLILRKKQGLGKPNLIYVKKFICSAPCKEEHFLKCENDTSENVNLTALEMSKVYEAYRKSGYSRKFFEEHREEIQIHKAAKQAFEQLPERKVPSRKSLNEEFHRCLSEKKKAYTEYRQVKKEMQEYLTAKRTVENILGIDWKKGEGQKKKNIEYRNR